MNRDVLIILVIFFMAVMPIIFNMIGMKKLEKNNQNLDKTSEQYIKNRKKIFEKFIIIIAIIYIVEILFFIWNYNSSCNCGYTYFKVMPIYFCIVIQFISNVFAFRLCKNAEHITDFLIIYSITLIMIFISITMLSKGDRH